jgi:hypothetical protein
MKLIPLILSLTMAVSAQARMVRVVSVEDPRSVTVEAGGRLERLELAGVEILDSQNAARLLQWTIGTAWVMAEQHPGGGFLLYRSPDALFVNRELVVRGYARATAFGIEPESNLKVTYLGQFDPVTASARGTDSGTSRRSTAKPSPKTPRRSAPASARSGSRRRTKP